MKVASAAVLLSAWEQEQEKASRLGLPQPLSLEAEVQVMLLVGARQHLRTATPQ